MLLQHLKVVLLIRGVLVDDEDVGVESGYDEAQVKLTDDLHVFERFFAVEEDDVICCICGKVLSINKLSRERYWAENLPDLFFELGLSALVFPGVDFGLEASIAEGLLGPVCPLGL